jgi:hypothetical protein
MTMLMERKTPPVDESSSEFGMAVHRAQPCGEDSGRLCRLPLSSLPCVVYRPGSDVRRQIASHTGRRNLHPLPSPGEIE